MRTIFLLLTLFPIISFGQINYENLITVIGSADKEIEPDWVQLGMSAKETENSRKESETVNMENSILDFVVSLGLDSTSFSIDRYSANTKYTYSSSSKFKLEKSYKLKIEKTQLLDTIIAKCFDSGIDNIYVSQIGHSKIDSIQNVVLNEALLSAKTKAKLIATTMEVNLGKIKSVNESYRMINNQPGSYQFNDYQLEEMVVVGYGVQSKARIGSSLSFQKILLTKTVIVKYEIQ